MYKFLTVIARIMISIPVMISTWLVSFFAFEQSFLFSSVIAFAGAFIAYGFVSTVFYIRFLKKHHLSVKEDRYIRKNLADAKKKIYRIQKVFLSIRQISFLKDMIELLRIIRKIYAVTTKEPKRFFQGDKFYFSHLDSAVEMIEKYALLASQPQKNAEVEQVLYKTTRTIKELKVLIEKDLYQILSNDIEQLDFELDVAKHSINSNKES
ncbi:5-bromo-4-chloroindolyl phosphate hydrolysis family protein [Aquibacillus rhizosphaerae]|uniref:5-bromo-4-chloroindolyl phosphate hydrolysis family protein n=1 Tax=Aquibacillus rhizosphaerae TaxID=3051431 RepID=A0ABT7L3C6_9BACI|nr:5-bromo-4-chloroindolyl phosphate hydrolysis family protein [Aquibacillus sp. LR5S19]MDL4840358.1 5-bromo-4-chloroindolyl phosphate hydrolysis family protein [Aquibacillus sp. LR5S19]